MRIRVSLVPSEEFNAGTAEVGFVNVECGKGTQIVDGLPTRRFVAWKNSPAYPPPPRLWSPRR